MDFFESQDIAKRNTGRLIILFVLAVVSLIVVTNFLVLFIFGFVGSEMTSMGGMQSIQFSWELFLIIGGLVSGIILFGSLYKISALSGGGARVAEMINGQLLVSGTNSLEEQRVLNVVEEMALASGTPVPPVYLMEEAGINAFAAGYSPSDAVIGITRGAINILSRDQLQGVIAHEFSHILHGDMRINIRLIGVLHGILVLGIIGYHLMRSGAYSRRSKNSGGVVFLGLGLIAVGFVGTFFGNLIKAAVSRQREYLADASAVQFTRNPEGIAGALMQIGKASNRSYLEHPNSAEISHALFEEARVSAFKSLYATHPPLDQRIAAILPGWSGDYHLVGNAESRGPTDNTEARAETSREEKLAAILAGTTGVIMSENALGQVGSPNQAHIEYARALVDKVPEIFMNAAHEPCGARALVYLFVLSSDDEVRHQQVSLLEQSADKSVLRELMALLKSDTKLQPEFRMALTEIALGSLRQLSIQQYELFSQNFNALIELDRKINLLEWSLHKLVFYHLDVVFEKSSPPKLGKRQLQNCSDSVSILLSILARSSPQQGISTQQAIELGAKELDFQIVMRDVADISFEDLNEALSELVQVRALQKPALLKACAKCVTADGNIAVVEAELIRAIAATIDCPMPPLVE